MKTLHLIYGVFFFICVCHFLPDAHAATDGLIFPYKRCESDSDCTQPFTSCRLLDCAGFVCRCYANMTLDEGGDKCLEPRKLGESCDNTTRCVFTGAMCSAGTCACESGLVPIQGKSECIPAAEKGVVNQIASGSSCTPADRCFALDENCVNSTCQCGTGYREATENEIITYINVQARCRPDGYSQDTWNSAMCGFVPVNIGDECGADNMTACPSNGICVWKNCTSKMCICEPDYLPSLDGTSCLKAKHLNELCSVREECVDFESTCNGTTCVCSAGFRDDGQGNCVLIDSTNWATHNQSCGTFLGDRMFVICMLTTYCDSNHICSCLDNFVLINSTHRQYRHHPSFFQCTYWDKFWLTDEEHDVQCMMTTTIPTTTEELITVGRNCTGDNICPNGSSCIEYGCGKACVCDFGMIKHSNGLSCVPSSPKGGVCTTSENCAFSDGECVNGVCQCEDSYVPTSDNNGCKNAQTGAPTGGDCNVDNDCYLGIIQLQSCSNSVCVCNAATQRPLSYLEFMTRSPDQLKNKCVDKTTPRPEDECGTTTTPTIPTTTTPTTTTPTTTTPTTTVPTTTVTPHVVKIDAECDDTIRLCPGNSTCEAKYASTTKSCRCNSCFYYNSDKTGCLAVRYFDEDCDHGKTTKCSGSNGIYCSQSNKCACGENEIPNKYYCLQTFREIHMSGRYTTKDGQLATTECGAAINKYCESQNLECVSNRCQCKSGYRDADANDRCAVPTLNRNCVPSNWTSGYRPPIGSPEASLLTANEKTMEEIIQAIEYEKAQKEEAEGRERSKLIIAACIGATGLFLILICIAVFVRRIIRKRNRKTIDDDSSTRSDSSRLSLYRGFATWLGKNYNKPVH